MAMYNQIAPKLAEDFKKNFGELTLEQIWTIVKFAKMVRRSCRSNAAFNPAAELCFPGHKFSQYDMGKRNSRTGKPIMGLRISKPGTQQVIDDNEEDGDE